MNERSALLSFLTVQRERGMLAGRSGRQGEVGGRYTHVVEVFYGETVAFYPSDAIDEEGAGCAHEAASGGGREGALEGEEEGMCMERGRSVRRGRARRYWRTRHKPDKHARSIHTSTSDSRSDDAYTNYYSRIRRQ